MKTTILFLLLAVSLSAAPRHWSTYRYQYTPPKPAVVPPKPVVQPPVSVTTTPSGVASIGGLTYDELIVTLRKTRDTEQLMLFIFPTSERTKARLELVTSILYMVENMER